MKQQLFMEVFKPVFIYFFVAAVSIKVYRQLKAENISFKEYLIKRKPRLVLAMLFIVFTIGCTYYMLEQI